MDARYGRGGIFQPPLSRIHIPDQPEHVLPPRQATTALLSTHTQHLIHNPSANRVRRPALGGPTGCILRWPDWRIKCCSHSSISSSQQNMHEATVLRRAHSPAPLFSGHAQKLHPCSPPWLKSLSYTCAPYFCSNSFSELGAGDSPYTCSKLSATCKPPALTHNLRA
jgi:hypothetical protein